MFKHIVKARARIAQVRNERGATAVEYGLMVALVAAAILVGVSTVGVAMSGLFTQIAQDPYLSHPTL